MRKNSHTFVIPDLIRNPDSIFSFVDSRSRIKYGTGFTGMTRGHFPLWQRACPELAEGGTKEGFKSLLISL